MNKLSFFILLISIITIFLVTTIHAEILSIKDNDISFDKLSDNIIITSTLQDGTKIIPLDIEQTFTKVKDGYELDQYVTADKDYKDSSSNPELVTDYQLAYPVIQFSSASFGYRLVKNDFIAGILPYVQERIFNIDYSKELVNSNIALVQVDQYTMRTIVSSRNTTLVNDLKSKGGVWHIDPTITEFTSSSWSGGSFNNTYNVSNTLFTTPDAQIIMSFNENLTFPQNELSINSFKAYSHNISVPPVWFGSGGVGNTGYYGMNHTNRNVIEFTSNSIIKPLGNLTFVIWQKSNQLASDTVFMGDYDPSSGNGCGLRIQDSGQVNGFFLICKIGGSIRQTGGGNNLNNGAWHMIAGRINDTGQRTWVDGVRQADTAFTGAITWTTRNFSIGGDQQYFAATNGYFDEPRFFSRALTDADILSINNSYQFNKYVSTVSNYTSQVFNFNNVTRLNNITLTGNFSTGMTFNIETRSMNNSIWDVWTNCPMVGSVGFGTTTYCNVASVNGTSWQYRLLGITLNNSVGWEVDKLLIDYTRQQTDTSLYIYTIRSESITNSTAVINWESNFNGNSTVEYTTDFSFTSYNTTADSSFTTIHTINLANLTSDTRYYYRVRSCNNYGDCAPVSGIYTFDTLATTDIYKSNNGTWILALVISLLGLAAVFIYVFVHLDNEHTILKLFFFFMVMLILVILIAVIKIMVTDIALIGASTLTKLTNLLDILYNLMIVVIGVLSVYFFMYFNIKIYSWINAISKERKERKKMKRFKR